MSVWMWIDRCGWHSRCQGAGARAKNEERGHNNEQEQPHARKTASLARKLATSRFGPFPHEATGTRCLIICSAWRRRGAGGIDRSIECEPAADSKPEPTQPNPPIMATTGRPDGPRRRSGGDGGGSGGGGGGDSIIGGWYRRSDDFGARIHDGVEHRAGAGAHHAVGARHGHRYVRAVGLKLGVVWEIHRSIDP